MANTIFVIKDWINDKDYHKKHKNLSNIVNLNYQESKLFAIKNYPEKFQSAMIGLQSI